MHVYLSIGLMSSSYSTVAKSVWLLLFEFNSVVHGTLNGTLIQESSNLASSFIFFFT